MSMWQALASRVIGPRPCNESTSEVAAGARARESDRLEVDGVAAREADPRDGHGADGRILELAAERLLVDDAVARGDAAIDDAAAPSELHPGIDVRGELPVWREDDVTRA